MRVNAARAWSLAAVLVQGALLGCESIATPDEAGVDAAEACPRGTPPVCVGDLWVQCLRGGGTTQRDCTLDGLRCAPELGCTACVPGAIECLDGTRPLTCRPDGSGFDDAPACDVAASQVCADGRGCIPASDLCGAADVDRSYLGCEYWPTVTLNNLLGIQETAPPPDLEEFRFAVAVANPQPVPAEVRVTRGGEEVVAVSVAPLSTETIVLDWVESLRAPRSVGSSLVPSGAYRLTSSVPVSAFQFNALQYRVDSDPPRYSYTNDASLLFPARAVRCAPAAPCRFVTVNGPALPSSPAFVSITATSADGANVTVTPRVAVRASTEDDGVRRVPDIGAGETVTLALQAGDVLALVAVSGDLTGTSVSADAPIAVLSGNGCANVPANGVTACDHLEESVPPVAAWGTRYLVRRTRPAVDEPNVLRVVAARDGTEVRYSGERTPDVLQAGESASFLLRDDTLSITSSAPVLVAQFLVGQSYSELAGSAPAPYGDPSMSVVAPVVQFRRSYVFLTPATYERNAVSIVGAEGGVVSLDGLPVPWSALAGVASADVSLGAGYHTIRGDRPFGIQVYSLADYTSYLYPGGLNLLEVNVLE